MQGSVFSMPALCLLCPTLTYSPSQPTLLLWPWSWLAFSILGFQASGSKQASKEALGCLAGEAEGRQGPGAMGTSEFTCINRRTEKFPAEVMGCWCEGGAAPGLLCVWVNKPQSLRLSPSWETSAFVSLSLTVLDLCPSCDSPCSGAGAVRPGPAPGYAPFPLCSAVGALDKLPDE